MKVSVRPLKADPFDLDVEPADTVEAFKAKVTSVKPEYPCDAIKVVFAGRVMQDDMTLEACGVKEGDFVVVMQSKPKAAAPAATAPAVAPAAAPVAAVGPAVPSAPAAQPAAAPPAQPMINPESVQMLCDMGFPRSEVEKCLRAAFGNADRAVEYLMSGIPAGVLQQMSAPKAAAPAPPAAMPGAAPQQPGQQPGMNAAQQQAFQQMMQGMQQPQGPPATGPLASLANNPMFPRVRHAIQNEPASLNRVMTALSQTDPNIVQTIMENQAEFVELLQAPNPAAAPAKAGGAAGQSPAVPAPATNDAVAAMMAAVQAGGGMPGMPGMPGSGAPAGPPAVPGAAAPGMGAPPPAQAAQLSPAEQAAVERLQSFGFPREACVEAYIACERNEEMAAAFLFDAADGGN